ncbi:MAG: hypothetical protein QNJ72_16405 [Pleurocapsa sp. MO_226.B13]|nr:hypothetical protein [Pleurocapsa sp. MO_226.B13]
MPAKNSCPCCSDSMLRHLSNRHSYWFCPSCRIEMPDVASKKAEGVKSNVKFNSASLEAEIVAKNPVESIAAR